MSYPPLAPGPSAATEGGIGEEADGAPRVENAAGADEGDGGEGG